MNKPDIWENKFVQILVPILLVLCAWWCGYWMGKETTEIQMSSQKTIDSLIRSTP